MVSSGSMSFSKGLEKELKRFQQVSPKMFIEAMKVPSIQFITNMVEGRYGPKPPILNAILRGSFSTFVNNVYLNNPGLGGDQSGQVQTSDIDCSGPRAVWVSNMPYASRMENREWTPGERSASDGGVGNKFLATALNRGAEDYGRSIAEKMRGLMDSKARGL